MPHIRLPEPGIPYVLVDRAQESTLLRVNQDIVIALYKTHGALLFRGFGTDLASFGDFARQFCSTSVHNESPGRDLIDPVRNVHSVDHGNAAFPLHPELSREAWRPDVAFFACLKPPAAGGATTICDGVELVRELPAAVRQGLTGRRLVHYLGTWPGLLQFWLGTATPDDALLAAPPQSCPYKFRRINGRIMRAFSRPALYRPMFSEDLAFGNFLLFARYMNGRRDFPVLDDGRSVPDVWMEAIKATSDRLTVPIVWQAGDVLMIDNTRFMHGRTAIPDNSERWIASYFGYLGFARLDAEEPVDPPWRQPNFRPPIPPVLQFHR